MALLAQAFLTTKSRLLKISELLWLDRTPCKFPAPRQKRSGGQLGDMHERVVLPIWANQGSTIVASCAIFVTYGIMSVFSDFVLNIER